MLKLVFIAGLFFFFMNEGMLLVVGKFIIVLMSDWFSLFCL